LEIDLSINPKEISIIISDFIKTYIQNSGCNGVIIGLSGGIDSAVTAILCKNVLGKKNTNCVFLPDNATPKSDNEHMDVIVKKFDLNCKIININNYLKNIDDVLIERSSDLAFANIKARLRMLILYEFANKTKNIVCGTSNKSELLIGYFTKYGDGGVDIMPIGDLYKSQIFELAKYLEIPFDIINKPPTAGLIKDQTDENELKISYKNLDLILAGLEKKMDILKISKITNIKISEIKRIKNMRIISQHKRRGPLIPKLGLRTSGLDWRSPIQEG
jgi:NAD+ synthase